MQLYTVTIPATEQPISLTEAKLFMKVSHTAEDALITALIVAATETIEKYTGLCFVVRTFTGEFDSVYTGIELYPCVKLMRAPLNTVTSVQVSTNSTFGDTDYQIKTPTSGFSRILLTDFYGGLDDIPYPLKVVFSAGYGAASAVPESIKLAIKEYVNYLYRNRGDCELQTGDLPLVIKALLPAPIKEVFA